MYEVTSQGSNQESYTLVIGPEKQYTGQSSGHFFKLFSNILQEIISLKENNNVNNAIVKFTEL